MARKKRRDDDEPKKKKKKAREEEYDDLEEAAEDLDEEVSEEDLSRPRNDAYTGMLVITLVALIGACAFFFLDHAALTEQSVQAPSVTVPALGSAPAAAKS
ncbi:MAG TPA: hypothetical protein VM533_12055 [Fimbriiglobus sp.]|jgi:hypothetical protein|nr:hypothetical protein [Fimbriiglobus sp.]